MPSKKSTQRGSKTLRMPSNKHSSSISQPNPGREPPLSYTYRERDLNPHGLAANGF